MDRGVFCSSTARLLSVLTFCSPQYDPSNATAWIKFTELETILQDVDRVRAIYEMAVNQPSMDMPELIWKSWIDFEFEEEEYDRTRELYERLLRRTSHVKVWVSFAQFEANAGQAEARTLSGEDDEDEDEEEEGEKAAKEPKEIDQEAVERAKEDGLERARKVYERGYADLKKKELKDEASFPLIRRTAIGEKREPNNCIIYSVSFSSMPGRGWRSPMEMQRAWQRSRPCSHESSRRCARSTTILR